MVTWPYQRGLVRTRCSPIVCLKSLFHLIKNNTVFHMNPFPPSPNKNQSSPSLIPKYIILICGPLKIIFLHSDSPARREESLCLPLPSSHKHQKCGTAYSFVGDITAHKIGSVDLLCPHHTHTQEI